MHAACNLAARSAHRQKVILRCLLHLVILVPFALLLMAALSSCTDAREFAETVEQDAQSPAGQQLLNDATSDALNITLSALGSGKAAPVVAGVQAAAALPAIVRDFKALPSAPSSSTVTSALAASPSAAPLAPTLGPAIAQLVARTQQSAQAKHVRLRKNDVLEAVARGTAAAPAARYVPPVTTVSTGEAP